MMSKRFLPIMISWTKRQRFIITAVTLSLGLGSIQLANISWRYQAIGLLAVLTYLLGVWSLREGLDHSEWLMVFVLPVFYTIGVGLFYFLLPAELITQLPVVVLYGVGMYALLLTNNIFSVAAIRTIQLLRAAHAVGFLFTLVTAFFLYDTILSFRLDFWLNFLLAGAVSLPLILAALWSVKLEEKISKKIWLYSFGLSFILGQMALAFSFWPVSVASGSLFLVTVMYVVLGLSQLQLGEQLFKRSIYEYLGVGMAILVIMILTTGWG